MVCNVIAVLSCLELRCFCKVFKCELVNELLWILMRVEIGKYITIDDEACHGKPIFKGTRILVSNVIKLLAAGDGAVLTEK